MAEYISREITLDAIRELSQRYNDESLAMFAYDIVTKIPNADVQPVRRGEWEIFWQNGKPKLKCTNCHSLFDIRTNDKHICIYPKFCEECGAYMRGEDDA